VIADTHYELPVAVVVTCASASESPTLRQMIGELFTEQPVLAQRCEDFSADRGLDAGETKALLWDTYRIRPLIDSKRSAHPPLRTHDHSRFLSGNNSSMRLLGQEGSFSRVSISQAMGSMPFRRAVSSSD
jgi:hypothetical protein